MNTILELTIYVLSIAAIIGGVAINLFNMPGSLLIFAGITGIGIGDGFEHFSPWWLPVFLAMALFAGIVDNFAMDRGIKKLGGSESTSGSAFLGAALGTIVLNLPGMLIGAFLGALLFEMLIKKRDWQHAVQVAFGSFVGFITGYAAKFLIGIGMIVLLGVLWLV